MNSLCAFKDLLLFGKWSDREGGVSGQDLPSTGVFPKWLLGQAKTRSQELQYGPPTWVTVHALSVTAFPGHCQEAGSNAEQLELEPAL